MTRPRELFVSPRFPAGGSRPVSRVRSTLLSASLQGVRSMGWEKRYFEALPATLHEEIRLLIAGLWVPIELAIAHYTACDRMGLSSDEVKEMGKAVSIRTQRTFVGALGSVAVGAGATPWSVFQHSHRIWARIFEGGDDIIYKLGPKDMEIVAIGCPLVRINYFRAAMGAYYGALAGVVAKSVHWREHVEHKADTITVRLSWV